MTIRLWFLASITLMAVPALAGILDLSPAAWAVQDGNARIGAVSADR